MTEIKSLLDAVIEREIHNLESLSSEERSDAIRDLTALHKLRIEEIKVEMEAEEKAERRAMDKTQHHTDIVMREAQATNQLRDQKIDRFVKLGIAAAELVLPLMFYGVWMKKGLKFEETGTFTSQTFKGLFNRFKPTRKG